MSARSGFQSHAFANNPLRSKSPKQSFQTLTSFFQSQTLDTSSFSTIKILPFKNGKPLSKSATSSSNSTPSWHLAWMGAVKFREFEMGSFVYLGSNESSESNDCDHWAVDVGDANIELGEDGVCFVELRTLMVATDWGDAASMKDLAIAGHARAILEWHKVSRFCGHCGSPTTSIDAGRRKQCTDESCKRRVYPRVDPVVIMLVIDKENDCCLLSRQSKFVPRMWSCLAGFIEPGESLEEAVRRETWEEAGIEVGDVIYHSSQPWPVGPNSMPCQLMVGFFAFAKSFTINVDKTELQDAKWHSREEVEKALTYAEYEKAQKTSAFKVNQMCKGVERSQSISSDFNIESGELAPMFVPGPYAIAHHLISSWVNESPMKQLETNMSNL